MPVRTSISAAKTAILRTLDLSGTFTAAFGGGLAGIEGGLDILGVTVLAFATAFGGGIIRDVLLGATPPVALRDWRYPAIAIAGATASVIDTVAFRAALPPSVAILDAASLSLFAIAGAEKALDYEVAPLIAIMLGGLSGVGGGTIRDVLLTRVPTVLHSDFYASAALLGAAAMVACRAAGVRATWSATIGGTLCFALRLAAIAFHWNLPIVGRTS